MEYEKGINKGQSTQDELTNGFFGLGTMDYNYTGNAVIETVVSGQTAPGFTAVAGAMVNPEDKVGYKYKISTTVTSTGVTTVTYSDTFPTYASTSTIKVAYIYDNQVIPQDENKIPTLKAVLQTVALEAKPRRIAVQYSQLAAFQAKTDYGFDLADGLAEQAASQLAYEIDSEIVDMLYQAAPEASTVTNFSKTFGVGVGMNEWYAGFGAKIEEYKAFIFTQTKKFMPNFMVCAPDIMPVLSFVPGFQAAPMSDVIGPYYAGTVAGMKVFVSPNMPASQFYMGVNRGLEQASAGVYAPYMAVVPTQLLGFADGTMSQGWSTMYDCKVLNASLLVKGAIEA